MDSFRGSSLAADEFGLAFPGIHPLQHPAVSVRQFYEMAVVQETIHYLQDQGVPGLVSLPPREARRYPDQDLVSYWGQPHKVEATHYTGLYFQQKYGKNPFTPVEAFYQSRGNTA